MTGAVLIEECKPGEIPEPLWINAAIGDLKTALARTFHTVNLTRNT